MVEFVPNTVLGRTPDLMRAGSYIPVIALAASLCGCATDKENLSATYRQQLALHQSDPVPLPASTPFDNDPDARAMYLKWFQDGYRSGLTEFIVTCCFPPGPYPGAQQKGWLDGQLQGGLAEIHAAASAK